jgi:putative aminopeptidase FrvX
MLSPDSIAFLKRLLDSPGPSGFESLAARVWREEARKVGEVSSDVAGNSVAIVNRGAPVTVMLAGHIDEIGVIVTWIDDEGFVWIGPIGGWDPQVLIGQRIRFAGREGDVHGVIGRKPIHLIKKEEREKAVKFEELWVDIGATSRAEAEARLGVGDAGVIDARLVELPNHRIASRAIDDRIGAFVVLEALRRYAEQPGVAAVAAVATTQEEIGFHGGGALIAAGRLGPAMAIAVDVTHATDHPTAEKKDSGDHRLGGGPVLTRGSVVSPVVFRILHDAATRLHLPYTVQAAGRETSTDADFIHLAREGIATALVSIPNRYMHSPNEMVSLEDVDRTANLLAEACRSVTAETDFADR